jgi:DHA3 family macrolide efflux protein-like MFS transporter
MEIIEHMNEHWKKNTVLFLTSQIVSLFGSMLVQYAIMWYITLETKSGVMMTISIICGFAPTLLLSPFAGVWADRYNRKMLIVLADLFIATATLAIAILFLLGYDAIWLLFVVSAMRALGAGIQSPAVNAFLPGIVPPDKLMKITGINSSVMSAVTLVSPIVAGALLSFTTIKFIFFIDIFTAAIAVWILLVFLKVPAHAKALEKQPFNYFTDLKAGLVYISKHGYVKTIFFFCALYFILVAPLAFLTPLQVTRSYGDAVWRLTAIEVAFSLGMMVGGLVIATWGGFKNKAYTMATSFLLMAISTVVLGLVPAFWVYLVFMLVVGLTMPMFNSPFTVLLQQKVEPDFLGRVFGVLGMISSSVMPLSMLFFGPMADSMKIEWMLLGTGALMLVLSLIMMGNKVLIEAGRPVVD